MSLSPYGMKTTNSACALQSNLEVPEMATIRILASVLSVAVLLAGCDPRTELEQDAPNISMASMRAEGKGAVVGELFFDNIYCSGGEIILGSADGTEIHDNVTRRHWRAGSNLQFAGSVVAAGRHYILRLDCGSGYSGYQFAIYRQKPVWFKSPIYYPLGSFIVEPGEVVYIGSLHAATGKPKWFSAFQPAAIGIEDRSERVRELLREVSPAMAEAMVVRLAAKPADRADFLSGSEVPLPELLAPSGTDASAQAEQADARNTTEPGATAQVEAEE
jgi:hypothetical protein